MSNPAVFLDRDGVINQEIGYISSYESMYIFPFIEEAITLIRKKGYKCIVITNQSGIERGIIKEESLLEMNRKLISRLGLDDIYYCPHYITECSCRKPKPGMILKAAEEHDIDLYKSFLVGDTYKDILAGKKAKIGKTVFVKSGYPFDHFDIKCEPDYIFDNLLQFAREII